MYELMQLTKFFILHSLQLSSIQYYYIVFRKIAQRNCFISDTIQIAKEVLLQTQRV